jgi:hypothetical protein
MIFRDKLMHDAKQARLARIMLKGKHPFPEKSDQSLIPFPFLSANTP